jgi:type I restriction enzyme S subunit
MFWKPKLKYPKLKKKQVEITSFHYDYNPYEDVKNLLVEVPIEKIVSNSYSLNYAEYMKDETEEEQYEEDVIVKTLGEVCSIIKGNKKRSKDGKDNGLYPLYYCSILGNLYLDTFDYTGEGIIINKTNGSGKAMVYYGSNKYNVGETTIHFKSKINELQTKYIYYYLFHNIELLQKYYKGANQKSIVEEDLFRIKIPIPSLERQQEIVKYLDFIYEKANKTSNEKIAELKQLNEFCLSNQKIFGENVVKTLGEVSKINYGKRITKSKDEGSEYFAYGGGDLMSYKVNEYNRDGITYKISRDGLSKHNCITKLYGKLFLNDTALTLDTLDDKSVNNYYIGEFLLSQKKYIYDNCTHGTAQLHININNLMKLKIPIPPIERQKEIVEYCEYNDTLIKQLEKEIENNKKQAQQFITGIVKAQVKTEEKKDIEEDTETSSINTELVDEIVEKNEPIIKPNNNCPYIFTKGSNKGNQCTSKPKNGAVYCSKHKKYEVTENRNINKDNSDTEFIIEDNE